MTGEVWTSAVKAGQGFALCLAVAILSDLVLARPARLAGLGRGRHPVSASCSPGPEGRSRPSGTPPRRAQAAWWRATLVVGLGRLVADAAGLLLVFFLLPSEWALVGGALGLVTWRFAWSLAGPVRMGRQVS